jgi:hypothetical protein
MIRRSAVIALAAMLLLPACNDTSGLAVCNTHVTLAVTASRRPDISWTPVCSVTSLAVVRDSGSVPQAIIWLLDDVAGNFGPPVHFGVAPVGATGFGDADSLESGKAYKVFVTGVFRGGITDSLGFTAP